MPRNWPAPIDVTAQHHPSLVALIDGSTLWQSVSHKTSQMRAHGLLWQAWLFGRWGELEHGMRQGWFNPSLGFVQRPAGSLQNQQTITWQAMGHTSKNVLGWDFWLNVHPSPPNVWDAYRRACSRDGLPTQAWTQGLETLWSNWWRHASSPRAFQEMVRRLQQGHDQHWCLHECAGFDEALAQGWQAMDIARDQQGRFAKPCLHFARLAPLLQRWGASWDTLVGDLDKSPRLWRLVQDQWMFIHAADVEADGWIGVLLVTDANLWDGPQGIRSWWENAMVRDGALLDSLGDAPDLHHVWGIVQRVGEGSRLRATVNITQEGRARRRL